MTENKNVSLILLGIVAILAIVGLVLMFSQMMSAGAFASTVPNVYGGAIKDAAYPYYEDRGRPTPDLEFPTYKTPSTTGKRDPEHIASEMAGCPGGISAGLQRASSLEADGWTCLVAPSVSGGNCCYRTTPT